MKKIFHRGILCPINEFLSHKIIKVMKLSATLILISMVNVFASSGYSQQARITLDCQNKTIGAVLKEIEKVSEFYFAYNNKLINVEKQVSIKVENEKISNILRDIFRGTDVEFFTFDRQIVLTSKVAMGLADFTVTGKVTDENGNPLPGVTIVIKGTTRGTTTDDNGNYSISSVEEGTVLVFSFIGMAAQEVTVGKERIINITLKPELTNLEELVVIGYGVQKKRDLTGTVASVNVNELQKFKTVGMAKALQGLAAGVRIENTSGAPGASPDIAIRGVGTFGNHAPLIIVDGVESSLSRVDPSDIESFSVLKDGSAAAIYGSKAANGVILVTTKKGKAGQMKVSVDVDNTVNKVFNFWPMLSPENYAKVAKLAYENAGEVVPDHILNFQNYGSTDWMKEISRNGQTTRYRIGLSGGSDNITYDVSANLTKEKGVLIVSDLNTPVLRARVDGKKNRFSFGTIISYRQPGGHSFTSSGESALMDVIRTIPVGTAKDENGNWLGYVGTGATRIERQAHPLFTALNPDQKWENHIAEMNVYADYEIISGLKVKLQGKYNTEDYWSYWFTPKHNLNSRLRATNDALSESRTNWNDWQLTTTISYDKQFGNHSVNLLAGYEAKEGNYRGLNIYGENFPFPDLRIPANITDNNSKTIGGTASSESFLSQFARVNYNFMEKYYLNATVRRDGSSKFSPNNRFGVFPSVSVAWRVGKESFMSSIEQISDLKFRVSYGKLGNDRIGNYQYYSRMYSSSTDYEGSAYVYNSGLVKGYTVKQIANIDARWEVLESKNIGLDLSLLRNKLELSADYFDNQTIDLIADRVIPGSVGVNPYIKSNFGTMKNHGWEFSATYKDYDSEFKYSATVNLSAVKNEVVKLSNQEDPFYDAGYVDYSVPMSRTVEGRPMGLFYLYTAQGLFRSQAEVDQWNTQGYTDEDGNFVPLQPNAQPGDVRFVDINGDGKLDDNDKSFVGSPWPDFEYSLVLNGSYKGFDLTLNFGGVQGNDIFNGLRYNTENVKRYKIMNMSANLTDAWTPQNPDSNVPRITVADPNSNNRPSTLFLEDGSYFRLRLLQLGYTVPSNLVSKLNMGSVNMRLYVGATNLFTLTKYTGPSPEVSNGGAFEKGVDRGYYPLYKSINFGLQLSF